MHEVRRPDMHVYTHAYAYVYISVHMSNHVSWRMSMSTHMPWLLRLREVHPALVAPIFGRGMLHCLPWLTATPTVTTAPPTAECLLTAGSTLGWRRKKYSYQTHKNNSHETHWRCCAVRMLFLFYTAVFVAVIGPRNIAWKFRNRLRAAVSVTNSLTKEVTSATKNKDNLPVRILGYSGQASSSDWLR